MAKDKADETLRIRAYLLGELPVPEAVEIECRLAADAGYWKLASAVEEELFDDYARGRLDRAKSARFRNKFLANDQGLARLEFAQAFARPATADRRPTLTWAVVGVLLVVASFGSYTVGKRSFPHVEVDLRPGIVRSGTLPGILRIPSGAVLVDVLLYPDDGAGNRATVMRGSDDIVLSSRVVPLPDGGRKLSVPAGLLSPGTYLIQLDQDRRTVATFALQIGQGR